MSGRRLLTAAGAVGAAGAAYYFYNAGGDPKVAQKMAERMNSPFPHETQLTDTFQAMHLGSLAVGKRPNTRVKNSLLEQEKSLTTP